MIKSHLLYQLSYRTFFIPFGGAKIGMFSKKTTSVKKIFSHWHFQHLQMVYCYTGHCLNVCINRYFRNYAKPFAFSNTVYLPLRSPPTGRQVCVNPLYTFSCGAEYNSTARYYQSLFLFPLYFLELITTHARTFPA